jgi:hypothetical protein
MLRHNSHASHARRGIRARGFYIRFWTFRINPRETRSMPGPIHLPVFLSPDAARDLAYRTFVDRYADRSSLAPTGWTSRDHTPGPMAKPGAPWVGKSKRRK